MEVGVPIGPPAVGNKGSNHGSRYGEEPTYQGKSILWSVAYYIILVAGAIGFYRQLFPLTESSYALPVVLREE